MTLAGSFALVFQAALSSGAGDFWSVHSFGEEYVSKWDIELMASLVDGKITLKMLIKLLLFIKYALPLISYKDFYIKSPLPCSLNAFKCSIYLIHVPISYFIMRSNPLFIR